LGFADDFHGCARLCYESRLLTGCEFFLHDPDDGECLREDTTSDQDCSPGNAIESDFYSLYWNQPSNSRRLQEETIEKTLRITDIHTLLTENAAEVCYDPRPQTIIDPPIEYKNLKLAFSHVWNFFDVDRSGFIDRLDIRTNFFDLKDISPSGEVDKSIFDGRFKKNLLEFCFESAIVYDVWRLGDSRCLYDKDKSIYRANRCGNNEKGDLFALFDSNGDGVLSGPEFSNPLRNGDQDDDFLLSPDEFLYMVTENLDIICNDFEETIDNVISEMAKLGLSTIDEYVQYNVDRSPNC
jgi:hypothetical protein